MSAVVTPINVGRTPLNYALRYARIGWHVFPCYWVQPDESGRLRCACGDVDCKSPGKHPISGLVPRGQQDATLDSGQIERWWSATPQAHIGVFLAPSRLVAIDIDPRNGGVDTIAEIERAHGRLSSDVTQITGGAGEHRLFSIPAGVDLNLPGKLGPGVDVKLNGYIIAEPSGHISGGTYAWEASSDPLDGCIPSPLPDWLRSLRPIQPPAPDAGELLSAEQVVELRSALATIDPDDRDTWVSVGMALHSSNAGAQAYGLWSEWAQQSDKFDAADQARVWRSFKARGLEGLSLAYVFKTAQDRGWLNPKSKAAQPAGQGAAVAPKAPARPIDAAAFTLRDPRLIEPRDWLYRRIFIRRYVTGTFAPGAAAKTQINLVDLVTMACGFDLGTRDPIKRGPLRVWYVNVEDDRDEIERRLAAICLHYNVTNADLAGRLHVDTDREGRYLVAEQAKDGVIVRAAVVDAVLEQVKTRGIDLLLVDPLVGMHSVSENSNPDMNRVIAQLRRIAEEGDCGVHVIHHVRKGTGDEEVSAEDGRGASAVKDACRAIRTITPMSEREASDFGIPSDRRRFYVWSNPSGKPNLAPPISVRDWYFLADVGLGNARGGLEEDRIGVPVRWSPPSAFDGVSLDDCRRVWGRIGRIDHPLAEARASSQSPAWIGYVVCDVLGWARADPAATAQVKRMLSSWLAGAVVEEYRVPDGNKGRDVPCIRLGAASKLA